MKYINKLQDKLVLVFGGTSGIGYAVAEASIEYGAQLIITGSNQDRLDKVVKRLEEAYPSLAKGTVTTRVCDLSDASTLETNIKSLLEAVTDFGKNKLDHIAFTAGDKLVLDPVAQADSSSIMKAQNVRLIAPLLIAKHLPAYMHNSADSSFTITSGVNADKPSPGLTMVAAASAAVDGLIRGLAVDLAPIRVNAVSPGATLTELLKRSSEGVLQYLQGTTLVRRLGRPEDLAEAYLYVMKNGFVTGTAVKSNGGALLK